MTEEKPTKIVYPQLMDVAHAAEIHTMLLAHIHGKGPVELDASAVERTDAAGVQLVYSFIHELERTDRSWSWAETSESLTQSIRLAGLAGACRLAEEEETA